MANNLSEYVNQFEKIKVAVFQFRHLGQNFQPGLAIITAVSPQFKGESIIQKTEKGLTVSGFKIVNTLIIRDQNMDEIDRKSQLYIDTFDNNSFFRFDHKSNLKHFTFASEAYNRYSDKLFAIGKEILIPSSQLTNDPDSLELSDLIIGVRSADMPDYPFSVFPAHEFRRNDPLHIYFEIYNLFQDSKGKAFYSIEIGAVEMDKKGEKKNDKNQISILYDLESDSRIVKEQYGIDISKLKPGYYQFFIKIKDKFSAQQKKRFAKFKINKS